MRVLVGCERSAIIRDCFRLAGHEAWSCDLAPCDGDPAWHLQMDVLAAAVQSAWDLFIVMPPCTYIAASGLHWNLRRPGRVAKTKEALEFCSKLFALRGRIKRFCLENPLGCINTELGEQSSQMIQPNQFGDDASKETYLWLYGLPLLRPTAFAPPRYVGELPQIDMFGANGTPRWSNQTDSGQNKLSPSPTRAIERAESYPGVGRAMAQQWGSLGRV